MSFVFPTNASQVQAFAGALFGVQVGSATMAQVNADILANGGLAKTLNGYYSATQSSTAAAAKTVATNLGLTGAALTEGTAYITSQLNAAAADARGAVISNIVNMFGTYTTDATFGAAATAWNTKVASAVAYTGATNVAIGTANPAATGGIFALSTGVDTLPGTAGNDTFNALLSAASTLTALDNLNGGDGNDTLSISDTAGNSALPAGLKVNNIETAVIASVGDIADLDVSGWGGLTSLTTAGSAVASAIVAAATTNVSTTDASQGALVLGINGGKDVTVTSSLVGVASTSAGGGITIGASTAPKGAVVVTQTATSANAAGGTTATGSAVTVTGGTTVSVTQTIAATAAAVTAVKTGNITVTNTIGAIGVTGTADTTSVSVTQSAAVTAAASTTAGVIGVVNGAVTIADANAASATKAGTISTVSLNNYGASTISSSGLTTLNLSGTGLTLGITTGLTAPTNTALALNLSGAAAGIITDSTAATGLGYTTLNVATSTKASTVANIAAVDVTTLNVSGDQVLTLTSASGLTALKTVAVSGSAGIKADLSGATVTSIDAASSSGANTVTVDGTKANYAGGSGVDTVTITAAPTKAINGGSGTADVLVVNTAATDLTANGLITGFEVLRAGASANGLTLNSAGYTALQVGATAGALTFSNVAAGIGLTVDGAVTTGVTYSPTDSSGSSDVLAVTLSSSGVLTLPSLTAAAVETINITTKDTDSTAHVDVLTALVATSAKAITVTGNAGLTMGNGGNVKVASFDASGVTSGAVSFASATTAANAATMSIKGGAGNDVLSGSTGNNGTASIVDTILGGAGNDSIDGGAGADTIDGGDGTDTLATAGMIGTAVEGLNSGTSTGVVVNLSSAAITNTTINTAMFGNVGTAALLTSVGANKTALIYGSQDALFSAVQDTLVSIENVIGTGGADYIVGSAGDNVITGADGRDVIITGAGADVVNYGASAAQLVTYAGGDANANLIERITDFTAASDRISITVGSTFAGLVMAANTGFTVNEVAGSTPYALAAGAANITALTAAMETAASGVASTTGVAGTNTGLQAYTFATAAGGGTFDGKTYLVINDATAALAATDVIIDITGVTGGLTAANFFII